MKDIGEYGFSVVAIEVTNHCNMHCSFCPLPLREKPLQHMAKADVFAILEELSQVAGVDHVDIHNYGEPLLHPDIWRVNDKCWELGLRGQLATNGWLFTERCL